MAGHSAAENASSGNLAGIAAMVIAVTFFACGDTIVKELGRTLPVGQIMAYRGLFSIVFVGCFLAATGALRTPGRLLRPLSSRKVLVRSVSEVGATSCFFTGLGLLPLADATAISQFAPLGITAAAAVFLGAEVGWRRWLATLAGFLGVLLIVRPGTSAFNVGGLVILAAVAFIVTRDLVTRQLGRDVPTIALTAITAVMLTVFGFALGPFETWVRLDATALVLLALCALAALVGYHFIVVAMRTGDIAVVSPFRYVMIPMAVLLGYGVFGDVPDALTWLGIAVVIGAGLYTLHRERVRAGGRP